MNNLYLEIYYLKNGLLIISPAGEIRKRTITTVYMKYVKDILYIRSLSGLERQVAGLSIVVEASFI
jgi:hypothetical protein